MSMGGGDCLPSGIMALSIDLSLLISINIEAAATARTHTQKYQCAQDVMQQHVWLRSGGVRARRQRSLGCNLSVTLRSRTDMLPPLPQLGALTSSSTTTYRSLLRAGGTELH
uniref:SFRICE_030098 n=1 Tax=Spodoptera frugiperda TaxID=7108 RepID=A0A2H1WSI4_SPOFR